MKTKCKECGREIDLTKEEANHKDKIEILCQDCYGRWIYA